MQKLLIAIIVNCTLLNVNCFAQQYGWTDISANIPQTGEDLPRMPDVYFVSDNEGWITCVNYAEIYNTTDGGETFEVQTTEYHCNAIHMLNENEGYAGGSSGFVYRTTDGGENWNFHATMVATLTDISFPPMGDTGYCCGINGNIWSIDSSGVTKMTSGVPDSFGAISFPVKSEEGWACGGSIIRHFFNNEWIGDQFRPAGGYNAIYMVDSLNGWVVGDGGIIAHTEDGKNWFEQVNPDTQTRTLFDVFFLNTNEGWVVGSQGIILHTTNGGTTWEMEGAELTTESLAGVYFTSPTNGYVVGNYTVLKYGLIISVEKEEELPTEFSLLQNYPNPFNPSTKIKYSIPTPPQPSPSQGEGVREGLIVSLKVYDILGREVTTLVNKQQQPGTYEVEFGQVSSNRHLVSGTYFYRIQIGEFAKTKKMLLLK